MSAQATFYEGGKAGRRTAVSPKSLSAQAAVRIVTGSHGAFTQNTTVKTSIGPLGYRAKLIGGYQSFSTIPAGGALTVKIVAYDASANAEVELTEALNAEAATAREGQAFVVAATNVTLEADDTIEIHTIADNNAVGTPQAGGRVALRFIPAEDSTAGAISTGADLL